MDLTTLLTAAGVASGHAAAIAAVVIPFAAILTAVLPHPAPGSAWAPLRGLLDVLALNVGHATNARPGPAAPPTPPVGAVLALMLVGMATPARAAEPGAAMPVLHLVLICIGAVLFGLVVLVARTLRRMPPARLLPAVALLILLGGCTAAQQQLALAIAPAATGCALSAGMAVEAHAASAETDATKAAGSAVAVVTDPGCLAVLRQLGSAAAARSAGS